MTTVESNTPQDDRPTDLELVQAEVASETRSLDDLPDGAVLVPLGDVEVAVLHAEDWPSSANEDVAASRFLSWAQKVLATPEDVATWERIDPTNRQVAQFLNDWAKASGNDPKAATASRGSSRVTRGNLKAI